MFLMYTKWFVLQNKKTQNQLAENSAMVSAILKMLTVLNTQNITVTHPAGDEAYARSITYELIMCLSSQDVALNSR